MIVTELIERSNRLGSDPRNTNYAGGNTSAKGTATDPVTGEDVELLWVKGSGGDLGTLTAAGLAVLRLDRLRALVGVYPGSTARTRWWRRSTSACTAWAGWWGPGQQGVAPRRPSTPRCTAWSRSHKGGAAPSIDTAMHGCGAAARRSPAPGLRHRAGDRRRRGEADRRVLR